MNTLNIFIQQVNKLDSSFDNIYIIVVDTNNENSTSKANELFSNICPTVLDLQTQMAIVLTKNILGAFTFYTRSALQTIGLHHHLFNKGHGDHLELTYRAAKHGFTTPFCWFADIYGSWNMLHNLSDFTTDSTVRDVNTFQERFNDARNTFKALHGQDIFAVPEATEQEVIKYLKQQTTW